MELQFFSSPIGLGHITRDIAIASNFVGISTNFITGNGAAKLLKKMNLPVYDVYNPPSFIVQEGSLKSPAKWLWNYYKYYKDCKRISQKILKETKSDLIVSDEDFASLAVAQELKIPTVLITDILETNFTNGIASFVEKKMNKSMQEIIRKCDVVILPEDGTDDENIRRVGPIVRQTNNSREELRKKFRFDRTTILVSIGGTDAGLFLIEKSIEAVSKINQEMDIVIVSGPSVSKRFDSVRNFGFVENLHEVIYASDLLISLAGKSTIDEANAYGTPGIFIPIKGHFEQEDNAKDMGFEFEDIHRLKEIILDKLQSPRNKIKTDGARRAAEIIQKIIK